MAKEQTVTLNREETSLVDEALGEHLDRLTGTPNVVAEIRTLGFRLLLKLSRVLPGMYSLPDLSDWQLEILQRTYAPQPKPAPVKKPAPKGPAKAGGHAAAAGRTKRTKAKPPAAAAVTGRGSSSETSAPRAQLAASGARRRGGLMRAYQQAMDRGDQEAALGYKNRIRELEDSAAAGAAHA